jgi:putative PIN family toxin of toxin-antitoxin system
VRLVFDTNVLVSVLLTPGGTSDRALRAAASIRATFLYDARMLAEYRAVLSRPKFRAAIAPPMIERLLSGLIASGEKIAALAANLGLPDPDDSPFLEVALTGRADALVTGNARHFHPSHGITVVSPSGLLKLLAVYRA